MKQLKIILGIVVAGILLWIIIIYRSPKGVCTIRLERIVDPLPKRLDVETDTSENIYLVYIG